MNNTIDFIYDESGRPFALVYTKGPADPVVYYYVLNLQGDVVGLTDASGTFVAQYTYNAWGEILSSTGDMAGINPLRYRGYYYDFETGFYYLQSRYYDPANHRFINADSYASTGQGFVGTNMFAYCNNNPVILLDVSGCISVVIDFFEWLKEVISSSGPEAGSLLLGAIILVACYDLIDLVISETSATANVFAHDSMLSAADYLEPDAEPVENTPVSQIAQRFGKYRCKETASAIVSELTRNNEHGEIIKIE